MISIYLLMSLVIFVSLYIYFDADLDPKSAFIIGVTSILWGPSIVCLLALLVFIAIAATVEVLSPSSIKFLNHKGFTGHYSYDSEGKFYLGSVLDTDYPVQFSGFTKDELKTSFEAEVDYYIEENTPEEERDECI